MRGERMNGMHGTLRINVVHTQYTKIIAGHEVG